ncbi:hypothetical protein HMPREF9278_0667 [Mobiluncus mulieris FB024-16]|nr:hypothetical protein HMPREF9278_0667 [Mobiluncus mulieris FB024-16]
MRTPQAAKRERTPQAAAAPQRHKHLMKPPPNTNRNDTLRQAPHEPNKCPKSTRHFYHRDSRLVTVI